MLTSIMNKHLGDPLSWCSSRVVPTRRALVAMIRDVTDSPAAWADEIYASLVISDSYLLLGQLDMALVSCPVPAVAQQWALLSNRRLNLLHVNGKDISATEALSLFPKSLTRYGLDNLARVAVIVDQRIHDLSRDGGVLESTIRLAGDTLRTSFVAYNGTLYSKEMTLSFPYHDFTWSEFLRETIEDLSRFAENLLREECGLPNVGEGWLAETRLFRELQRALPALRIEQHASPEWLGRQHLDVYLPDIRIAVEYQGPQHEQPVAYFGGQAAFELQKKRDNRKRLRCKRHGVRLVYVHHGYDLLSLVAQVVGMSGSTGRATG